jgi:predicted transcriptional regulator
VEKIAYELKLTSLELESNVKKQMEFLKLVYPDAATDESFKDGTIELRFLRRTFEGTKNEWSFNAWTLNDTSEKLLLEKMTKMNGLPCCTYYSGYTFNRFTKDGKKVNQITKQVSLYTSILPMDFDGITESEFLDQKRQFAKLGIETVDIFSGHGYQSIILLNEKSYDKELFAKFTDLLLQKGFPVDSKIRDSARILRLPYTFNCKAFLKRDKYYDSVNPEAIPTFVYKKTTKRYSLERVFEKLNSLPDVKPMAVKQGLESIAPTLSAEESPAVEAGEKKLVLEQNDKPTIEIKSKDYYRKMYKHLNFDILPSAIQFILMGTPSGIGNDTLLFLVPYLKNTIGLSIGEQIETLQTWGGFCSPVWTKEEIAHEVKRLNKYNFLAKYGKYTNEMEDYYGELVFEEWKIEDEIIIPNDVLDKYVREISDGSFRLYLALKLLQHEEVKSNFTNEEIYEKAGVSLRTFERNIGDLIKSGLVTKKRQNRKDKGEKYTYYVNPFLSIVNGFVRIKASLVELLLLKDISDAQVTFYIYMKRLVGSNEGKYNISQQNLAQKLGKNSQTTISKLTDDLHAKKLIRKETNKIGNVKHSTYILLK